jgi:PKD repeat protein
MRDNKMTTDKFKNIYRRLLSTVVILCAALGIKGQCTVSIAASNLGNGAYTFTASTTPSPTSGIYVWNYGNGNFTTTAFSNPFGGTTYTANGTYTVVVTYSSSACTSSVQGVITVTNACTTQAGFFFVTGSSGSVTFTNTTTNPVTGISYTWAWGNAITFTSSAVNPTVNNTYTANGVYAVTLTASPNNGCPSTTFTAAVTVTNAPSCSLTAGFVYSTGPNGTINFSNTSTGTVASTSYTWAFGNGNQSFSTSPANTYTANGVYVVTLTAIQYTPMLCQGFYTAAVTVTNVPPPCNTFFFHTVYPTGQVIFTATTTPSGTVLAHYWNFGNNTSYSTGITNTASSTYTATGVYTVTLLVITPSSTCMAVDTVVINSVSLCPVNANFTLTQGPNGLVNFSNTTTGTVSGMTYTWNFGDNSVSTQTSPSHYYTVNGSYIVTLVASNGWCTSTKTLNLNVSSVCGLYASFTHTVGSNGNVQFQSTSTGTQSNYFFQWNFGDNTTGTGSVVTHNYANGTYMASLTVKNASVSPTCSSVVADTILISNSVCSLTASFTHTVSSGGNVFFTNTSTGSYSTSGYAWNFGDGFTGTGPNPTHMYSNGGTHYIKFTVTNNAACIDTVTQAINITGINCVANSNFTVIPTNIAKTWFAIPSYPWNVVAATWYWGDGNSSNSLYTSHQYSVSGNYNICLSVTVSCSSTSSSCSTYSIFRSAADILNVNVISPQSVLEALTEYTSAFTSLGFPNPANTVLNVKAENIGETEASVTLYNLVGELVHHADVPVTDNGFQVPIDVQALPCGLYILRVQAGNTVNTQKVMINR